MNVSIGAQHLRFSIDVKSEKFGKNDIGYRRMLRSACYPRNFVYIQYTPILSPRNSVRCIAVFVFFIWRTVISHLLWSTVTWCVVIFVLYSILSFRRHHDEYLLVFKKNIHIVLRPSEICSCNYFQVKATSIVEFQRRK